MSNNRNVRIQDVASKAGVSMMTVSRVMNKNANVSNKTREKVLTAAKELHYRPNVSARQLASTKSFFLGLLYNNPSASYVSQFLLNALKQCRKRGYHLVVDETSGNSDDNITLVKDLINTTRVDGIILLPPVSDDCEIIKFLIGTKTPFVRISPDRELNLAPYICMDDYHAAFDVTEKLIKQGHKNIAHIIGHPDQGVSGLRYQGFLDALRSNQINVPPEYIEQGYFTYESGLTAANKLLSLEEPPSAIFASNDDMAAATITSAHIKMIAVPDQLSVVGFDDTQIATTVTPHLSTVKQPIEEMAYLAIEMLSSGKLDDLSSVKSYDLRQVLDYRIIERESSLNTEDER